MCVFLDGVLVASDLPALLAGKPRTSRNSTYLSAKRTLSDFVLEFCLAILTWITVKRIPFSTRALFPSFRVVPMDTDFLRH